jgi:hypothetical protein
MIIGLYLLLLAFGLSLLLMGREAAVLFWLLAMRGLPRVEALAALAAAALRGAAALPLAALAAAGARGGRPAFAEAEAFLVSGCSKPGYEALGVGFCPVAGVEVPFFLTFGVRFFNFGSPSFQSQLPEASIFPSGTITRTVGSGYL